MDNGILKKPYEISIWDEEKQPIQMTEQDEAAFSDMRLKNSDIINYKVEEDGKLVLKKQQECSFLLDNSERKVLLKDNFNNGDYLYLDIDGLEEGAKVNVKSLPSLILNNEKEISSAYYLKGNSETDSTLDNIKNGINQLEFSPRSFIQPNYTEDTLIEWTFASEDETKYSDNSAFNDLNAYRFSLSNGSFETNATSINGKYLLKNIKKTRLEYFQQGMKFLTRKNLDLYLPIYTSDNENKVSEKNGTKILQIYINTEESPVNFEKFKTYYISKTPSSSAPRVSISDIGYPLIGKISLGEAFPSNSLEELQPKRSKLLSFLIPGAYLLKNVDNSFSLKIYQNEKTYFLSNLLLSSIDVYAQTSFRWGSNTENFTEDNLDCLISKGTNYSSLSFSGAVSLGDNYPYVYSDDKFDNKYNVNCATVEIDYPLIFLSDLHFEYDESKGDQFYTSDCFASYDTDLILQISSEGVTNNNYPKIVLSNSKNGYISAQDYREKNSISVDYFKEKKLFIIGSDTMDSQARALKPKLVSNINGSNTLTFSMYYQYEDNISGETVLNPYCKYLCNERKIKLKHGDKWYDFVIKNIQENSETKEFIYTAKDLYINELSKNGFELTFDIEKENNIGTITYLGEKVVEGTDWSIDLENSDHLAEMKSEPLYYFSFGLAPTEKYFKNIRYYQNEPVFVNEALVYDYSTIVKDETIYYYFPYSTVKGKKTKSQIFYSSTPPTQLISKVDDDYNFIINNTLSGINSTMAELTWNEDQTEKLKLFYKELNSGTEKSVTITLGDGGLQLSDYRAKVLVQSQSMKYDPITNKLVSEYEDTQGHRVYCFQETEFTSPTLVRNLVTNSKYFTDTTGWDAEGNNNIKFDFYRTWWKGTIPYLGCKFPTTYIKNSGIEDNRSIINGFNAGEYYVLRIKASKLRPNATKPSGNKIGGYPYTNSDYNKGARGYMGWSTYWDTLGEDYGGCCHTFPLTNGRGLCGRIDEYDIKNGKFVLKEHIAHFCWAHTPDYIPAVNSSIYKNGAYEEVEKDKYFRGVKQSALKVYSDEEGNEYLRYAFRPYYKYSTIPSSPSAKDFLGYNNPIIDWTGGDNNQPSTYEIAPILIPLGEYEEGGSSNLENYKYKYMIAQVTKSMSYNDLLNKRIGLFLYTWGPYTWSGNDLSAEEAAFEGGASGRLIQNLRIEDIELFPFKTEDVEILNDDKTTTTMKKLLLPGVAPKNSVARNVYNCYYPSNSFEIEDIQKEASNNKMEEETSRRVYSDGTVVGSTYIDGPTDSTVTTKSWGINDEGSFYNTDFGDSYLGSGWIYDSGGIGTYQKRSIVLSNKIMSMCKSDYDIKRLLTDIYIGNQDLYSLIDDSTADNAINSIYKCGWRIVYMIRKFIKCYHSGGEGTEADPYKYNIDNTLNPQMRCRMTESMTHAELVIQIRKALDLAGFKLVFEQEQVEEGKVLNKNDIYYIYKGTKAPEEQGYEKILENSYEKKRILTVKESNRFNIIQKLSENFECWAKFTIDHEADGSIKHFPIYNDDGFFVSYVPQKKIAFKKFIGKENFAGFNYGINLKGIQRTSVSDQIVSKIIVKDNTNEFGEDGFCTITRANENPTKENILYNFDYYIHQNLLNLSDITKDLYDPDNGLGFYEKLRQLNIDKVEKNNLYSELYVSLQEITSNFETYKMAYDGAQEELLDYLNLLKKNGTTYSNVDEAISKLEEKEELSDIEKESLVAMNNLVTKSKYFEEERNKWEKDKKEYEGKLNILSAEFDERNKKIKKLYEAFYAKYSRFIQEGTWHSDDYYDDNQYYLDALNVANTSASPKVSYNISVIDVSPLEGYEAFTFEVGDKTFMTDPDYFGYISNGDLYKEEIVVSETTQMLDSPEQNQIKVQNYTSQFEDLFQRITAATQALEFNKNSYDRAAKSFTSSHNLR